MMFLCVSLTDWWSCLIPRDGSAVQIVQTHSQPPSCQRPPTSNNRRNNRNNSRTGTTRRSNYRRRKRWRLLQQQQPTRIRAGESETWGNSLGKVGLTYYSLRYTQLIDQSVVLSTHWTSLEKVLWLTSLNYFVLYHDSSPHLPNTRIQNILSITPRYSFMPGATPA